MKLTIDTEAGTLTHESAGRSVEHPLYSRAAFELISRQWLRVGWDRKYSYSWSWMGRPVIQLPEDMVRAQEAVHRVGPDVIVETGVAHGGSLVYYASLCKILGRGRVIGVDIEIRPQAREAVESHPLAPFIDLVEGNSIDPAVVDGVRSRIGDDERVLVFLDSNHSRSHVLAELVAYGPLVTAGSYIVATDGVMRDLHDVPGGRRDWVSDNPTAAVAEFVAQHPEFRLEPPPRPFDEGDLPEDVTYWPDAWLRRVSP